MSAGRNESGAHIRRAIIEEINTAVKIAFIEYFTWQYQINDKFILICYNGTMKEKFYITTAIAYTSGKPHIGNTYEAIFTDAIARFKRAQEHDYAIALGEIRQGKKKGHWMWYIFPQIRGLSTGNMGFYFSIDGAREAQAYIADSVLGPRLIEISEALLELDGSNPTQVMNYPDDMKLRSCMTLFAMVAPQHDVFRRVLSKYYGGELDQRTCDLLKL